MNLIHSRAWESWAPVVARLVFGAQFLFAAYGKLPGTDRYANTVAYAMAHGLPLTGTAVFLAFILEVVAGAMLLVGWHARLAAAVLVPYVLLLGAIFYHNFADPLSLGFFITHLTLAAGLLYVSVYGATTLALRKD